MSQLFVPKRRKKFAYTCLAAAVSSIVVAQRAGAQTLIFDNMTDAENGANGAAGVYAGGSGTDVVGGIYTLPTGTTALTGFDFTVVNGTSAEVDNLQVNLYVWGGVNTTTAVTSSTPAFSDLLGEYTADVTQLGLPAGYYTAFETGEPGTSPGFTLGSPLNIPTGISTIGISIGYQTSSSPTGPYAAADGLTSLITTGAPPSTDASGTYYQYFYLDQGGETNGNFIEGPYGFGSPYDVDDQMMLRIFANGNITSSGAISWNSPFSGDWNTASNWTPNTVPTSANDVIFDQGAASAYTVTVSQANSALDVYVQNDSVVLDLNQAASSLTITGVLSVGVPATSGTFTVGTLSLTHSYGGPSANISAASAVVGANGGNGFLTVGSGVNLVIAGNTAIGAGSQLTVAPGGRLYTSSLSLAGTTGAWTGLLDLGTSQLDLSGNTLATVTNMVAQGYAGGTWQGSGGITSSVAASDTAHLTAVGVISNNVSGSALYGSSTAKGLFGGQSPGLNDVLVKYTYYGDANLDGKVDGSDYSLIDNAYITDKTTPGALTGWFNGDFNYDGVIDGSDYTLIDNAFNQQGTAAVNPDALIGNNPDGVSVIADSGTPSYWSQISVNGGQNELGNVNPTASVGSSPVPEPTGLGLLGIGMIGLLRRRRQIPAMA